MMWMNQELRTLSHDGFTVSSIAGRPLVGYHAGTDTLAIIDDRTAFVSFKIIRVNGDVSVLLESQANSAEHAMLEVCEWIRQSTKDSPNSPTKTSMAAPA